MKVKEFIKNQSIDIDVYNDYDESLGIAYCGGYTLTPTACKDFATALVLDISIYPDYYGDVAVVHCENGKEAKSAAKLFNSLAGYCSNSDFDKWFKPVD